MALRCCHPVRRGLYRENCLKEATDILQNSNLLIPICVEHNEMVEALGADPRPIPVQPKSTARKK